jgi:hypothetical protein
MISMYANVQELFRLVPRSLYRPNKGNDLDYLCSSCKWKLFLFKYSRRKWCFINFHREFNGWALLSTSYAIRPTNNVFLKKE